MQTVSKKEKTICFILSIFTMINLILCVHFPKLSDTFEPKLLYDFLVVLFSFAEYQLFILMIKYKDKL